MTLNELLTSDIKTVFMNSDDFAYDFVNNRTTLTIGTIFDKEFIVIVDDVESTAPVIQVADTDVPGIIHGDTFTNVETSTVYNVTGISPDGTGLTLVTLSED